jgi:cytoskeletal protein RodZ
MKSSLQEMPTKQKIMIVATIIVVLIVIWQVAGLFGGNSAPAQHTPPAPSAMNANAPAVGGATQRANTMPGGQPTLAAPSSEATAPRVAPIAKDQYLQEQERAEKKYLKQLNDLEQLKLERQIEETNQAIATAKLATVTAEKSTAELLTKPTTVVADANYASQLVRPTRTGESLVTEGQAEQTSPVPVAPPATPDVTYTVISVSMQFNKWSAVMGAQGKLYNVSVGDALPPDGSVVVSINKSGVILKKDEVKRKVSLTSAI